MLPPPPPAHVLTVTADYGGEVTAFAQRVSEIAKRKVRVRIDRQCASACTMLAALPPARICVTPKAQLAFHEAYNLLDRFDPTHKTRNDRGTAELLRHYPPALRAWIDRKGGLGPDLIILEGAELRTIIPACRDAQG